MVNTTKAQRLSLHRMFVRAANSEAGLTGADPDITRSSYIKFRKTIQPLLGGGGCIMVHWCGMWLGIETDGHTHS